MKNPLSIETYVTVSNPHEVMRILKELGAPAVTSNEDLLNKVHYATDKFGAKMFERLADIETPYRSLILTEYEKERGGEKKSNCSGSRYFKDSLKAVPAVDQKSTADSAKRIALR